MSTEIDKSLPGTSLRLATTNLSVATLETSDVYVRRNVQAL
jgi:hypothetical protein